MNPHVNAIAGRLSLRPPQRESLEVLDRITTIVPPKKDTDIQSALSVIQSEFPGVTDFEREFPSLCFALATGVGKTRLMGAFISFLHLAHGLNNFFVLAPNLTIYNKLIADFTPNTPKYVFKGISEFAVNPPQIITGDNYESTAKTLFNGRSQCSVNIFNISKINSEVRGGKSPRIKRLSEYIGESYFDYLAGLPDLVLLMDESHRYRASAGVRAINELKPVLGLELTATPFIETSKGSTPFKNVIVDYPLSKAMADGFVKEPAVVTRKDFNPSGMSHNEIERMKLEDGLHLHESVKVELETYARDANTFIVKPFLLVIARDTTHAGQLIQLIQSDEFFDGYYRDKVIQVDSSRSGAEEEEMIERLLKVEHREEPTEIVIHVNMLKEGWDVTNLYTIVPLRAANARILIEQSIGRGLRLPYGSRTGVTAVDRLNIVAHDKFQEIIDEANKPDSAIHLQAVVLEGDQFQKKTVTVVSPSNVEIKLGIKPSNATNNTVIAESFESPLFETAEEQEVAQIVYKEIRKLGSQPHIVPGTPYLVKPDIQAKIVSDVESQYRPTQPGLDNIAVKPDIAAIVSKTTDMVVQHTIDIPRIFVVPRGKSESGFKPFRLSFNSMIYPVVSEELWIQHLDGNQQDTLNLGFEVLAKSQMKDFIVNSLSEFNDISYDEHADLLYDLAEQTIQHLHSSMSDDEVSKALQCYKRDIVNHIHDQMQSHFWEGSDGYDVTISKGFTDIKGSAYSKDENESTLDFHQSPTNKSNMSKYLFGGFQRCLFPAQKFDSEAERILAVILDRESQKWFRPAKGQFHIYYKNGANHNEYELDFVAEMPDAILMIEVKRGDQMDDSVVKAKMEAAVEWCRNASKYTAGHGGKPWHYLLIPHYRIAENMTVAGLTSSHHIK